MVCLAMREKKVPVWHNALKALHKISEGSAAEIANEIKLAAGKDCLMGNLYPGLGYLKEMNFLVSRWSEPLESRGGRKKMIYTITEYGREYLHFLETDERLFEVSMEKMMQMKDRFRVSSGWFDYNAQLEYPGCRGCENDGDYCRCGVITDIDVDSVAASGILQEFMNQLEKVYKKQIPGKKAKKFLSVWDKYCIARLFVHHKLYETDSYELYSEGGYYGEEVASFTAATDVWENFLKDVGECLSLKSNRSKILFVLHKEYSHIPQVLEESGFSIETVKFSLLVPPSGLKKLDGQVLDYCSDDKTFPIGIYYPSGEKYAIADGHNRWMALKPKRKKRDFDVSIIVAESNYFLNLLEEEMPAREIFGIEKWKSV
jgi:DNA-binding PadR family transcriptional regulator